MRNNKWTARLVLVVATLFSLNKNKCVLLQKCSEWVWIIGGSQGNVCSHLFYDSGGRVPRGSFTPVNNARLCGEFPRVHMKARACKKQAVGFRDYSWHWNHYVNRLLFIYFLKTYIFPKTKTSHHDWVNAKCLIQRQHVSRNLRPFIYCTAQLAVRLLDMTTWSIKISCRPCWPLCPLKQVPIQKLCHFMAHW